jgi:nucleotidyltransferase/DNA polymerase involved in DNA repair
LIFVVPKVMGENFPTQHIKYLDALAGTDLETITCKQIPGIGPKKTARLKDLGIENCAQLIDAYYRDEEGVQFVSSTIESMIRSRVNATKFKALQNIPRNRLHS